MLPKRHNCPAYLFLPAGEMPFCKQLVAREDFGNISPDYSVFFISPYKEAKTFSGTTVKKLCAFSAWQPLP
jgi:hypothetical protein